MIVVGIDPSVSCLGIVALENDLIVDKKTLKFPKEKGFLRLHLIATGVANLIEELSPEMVVIEHYAFSSLTLSTSVSIGAIIRYKLFLMSRNWLEVPPTVLKKWTTGKGNAKKPDMAVSVKARWDFESKSHDLIDAYALARLGQFVSVEGVSSNLKGVQYGQ